MLKVSIVTISFNQAAFLERAIRSVLSQRYERIEYIVVDPGSVDGSRDIIRQYGSRIAKVILEPDSGPADGLNKGFKVASGQVFAFLNSDDVLMPDAVQRAVGVLESGCADVVSAHAVVTDSHDRHLRMAYSETFTPMRYAYGDAVLIQPSTFFTRDAFAMTRGFNKENRSNWDGELFADMAMAGARFKVVNEVWSEYRLHAQSTTSSRSTEALIRDFRQRMFEKIVGRPRRRTDAAVRILFRAYRYARHPRRTLERILKGPIYGRRVD